MHIAHKSISWKSKATVLLAALTALVMIPLAPADAASAPGAFVVAGQAQLDQGIPGAGSGCFSGTALGTHGADPATPGSASARFTYANPNIVVGEASGELTIRTNSGALVKADFEWLRVGATAVVIFSDEHTGAAVAGFAPTLSENVVGPCQTTTNTDSFAIVAGAGVIL